MQKNKALKMFKMIALPWRGNLFLLECFFKALTKPLRRMERK
jgi:hypothetical protein